MKEDQWLDVEVPRRVVPLGLEKVSGYPFGETIFWGEESTRWRCFFPKLRSWCLGEGKFLCEMMFFLRKTFVCLFSGGSLVKFGSTPHPGCQSPPGLLDFL